MLDGIYRIEIKGMGYRRQSIELGLEGLECRYRVGNRE